MVNYYSRKEIGEAILELSKQREVVPRYLSGAFGSRPQTLVFREEYMRLIREGVTSFHVSEERWRNPMLLRQDISKKEMDDLRIGWDLVLDIDSTFLEYSRICASLLKEALEFHGIKHYSLKFSGGTGFHFGIPFEAFPEKVGNLSIRHLFPEGARVIACYLKELIKKYLAERMIEFEGIERISRRTGKGFEELVAQGEFNPYSVLNIDTIAISSRHLFRMHYCFNEKTWLVSLPIAPRELERFSPADARHDRVEVEFKFLDPKVRKEEARQLFLQAFDWNLRKKREEISREEFKIPSKAIAKRFFPPCIQRILAGLEDGRKRSLFILINFLRNLGWDWDSIERELEAWNRRNKEALPKSYLRGQLNWSKKLSSLYTPPNCDSPHYYKDIKVCHPDNLCRKVKNPLVYALKKTGRRWR